MRGLIRKVVFVLVAGAVLSGQAFTIARSETWIPATPCTMVKPGSALDFSSFGFTDGPCGKYGRIVARGDQFEYEKLPGKPLRFMGVNFCEGGNTLPRDQSRQLVDNLVRLGYNSVRIHHYERSITDPKGDGIAFDDKALDRFDALMASCREKGLYVTTDLFVSRRVPWRSIGEDQDGNVEYFKVLMHFHEGAKSNYLAFARNFLNHVNPYTSLRYAEDPTLAWIALVNEGNLGNMDIRPYMKYERYVLPKWRKWLSKRRAVKQEYLAIPDSLPSGVLSIPKDDRTVAFVEKTQENSGKLSAKAHVIAFQQFLASIEYDFYNEMCRILRHELGCRALITNMNGWRYTPSEQLVRNKFDYVDDHFYYAHPTFLGPRWTLPARITSGAGTNIRNASEFGVPYGVTRRIFGRPFTVSEYNYCPPWKNRAVSAFLCGTTASMQGWSALWRFCWTCDEKGAVDSSRKALNHFDMAGDPSTIATERAIFCLFMRRDMPELELTYPNLYAPSELAKTDGEIEDPTHCIARWAAYRTKLGGLVSENIPEGVKCLNRYSSACKPKTVGQICADLAYKPSDEVVSANGEVRVNRKKGSVIVDTPLTSGGFLEEPGIIETCTMKADVKGESTAIWVSSLNKNVIVKSKRLLLTLIGDVQNEGIEYEDDTMCVLKRWGRADAVRIARRTSASVSLLLAKASSWKVYALNPDGSRKREVKSTFSNGRLEFVADVAGDPQEAEFYYEITQ